MSERKKRIERFNLDRFIELIKLPIEVITEAEEPDFICYFNGTVLGVELTSLKKSDYQKSVVFKRK